MCGRFTSTSTLEQLAAMFDVDEVRVDPLPPRYNVAPGQHVYAVATRRAAPGEPASRQLGQFRWGLVPSWAKDPSIGNRMVNARAERLATTPAYRAAFARRRCVIPADAFYEWQEQPPAPEGRRRPKVPHAVRRRDGAPMALAGLWELWRGGEGAAPGTEAPLRTCVVVTTGTNDLLAAIHDRMPVVLDPDGWSTWLDPDAGADALSALLGPAAGSLFEAFPVSTSVNRVGNDGPELLRPLPVPGGGTGR